MRELCVLAVVCAVCLPVGSAGCALRMHSAAVPVKAPARGVRVPGVTAVPARPAARATPAPIFSSAWVETNGSPDLGVQAASGVVVDVDSRTVLWQREPHSTRAPASLAKLLTAMVASDLSPLDGQVPVPVEATQVEADSTLMGLAAGQVVTVRDLMYGVFLQSGNDAAETLARGLTGRDRFVELMNRKAAALGMVDSHFTNPSGLDEPGMRTTAYDMAVAAVAIATRYPDLLAISGTAHVVLPATASHRAFDLHALNRLVGGYAGATGLKTGHTDDAGFCLVGTAKRAARQLVAVLMGDGWSLTADAVKLLDYGFGTSPQGARPDRSQP